MSDQRRLPSSPSYPPPLPNVSSRSRGIRRSTSHRPVVHRLGNVVEHGTADPDVRSRNNSRRNRRRLDPAIRSTFRALREEYTSMYAVNLAHHRYLDARITFLVSEVHRLERNFAILMARFRGWARSDASNSIFTELLNLRRMLLSVVVDATPPPQAPRDPDSDIDSN